MIKGQKECEAYVNAHKERSGLSVMRAVRMYESDSCVVVCDDNVVYDPIIGLGTIVEVLPLKATEEPKTEEPKATEEPKKGGKRGKKN